MSPPPCLATMPQPKNPLTSVGGFCIYAKRDLRASLSEGSSAEGSSLQFLLSSSLGVQEEVPSGDKQERHWGNRANSTSHFLSWCSDSARSPKPWRLKESQNSEELSGLSDLSEIRSAAGRKNRRRTSKCVEDFSDRSARSSPNLEALEIRNATSGSLEYKLDQDVA